MTDGFLASIADEEIRERTASAIRLADLAQVETLSRFRGSGHGENKLASGFDPVTDGDREAERVMRKLIETEYPDDGIDGEEFGVKPSKSGWTWFLDPIDGTRAFIAGLPVWTTLIAAVRDEVPLIGIIDQPYLKERYIGWSDGAVLCQPENTIELSTRACTGLTDAILATTDFFIMNPAERGAFEHLRATAKLTRYGLDAYAYARLAAGTVDIVVETGLQPHDVAALIPVVRGAGGVAMDWRGRPAGLGAQIACAANQKVFDDAHISLRRSAS